MPKTEILVKTNISDMDKANSTIKYKERKVQGIASTTGPSPHRQVSKSPHRTLIRITTVPISLRKLIKGQMRFMSSHYEVIAVSAGGNLLDEVAIEESVRVKAVEMTREITLVKDLAALWKMYRLFRSEKPVIVHSHTPKAGIVGMLAAWLARVPIRLHTVAGLPLMEAAGSKRKLLNSVERLTYACATRVYPNSLGLKKFILENGFTQESKLKVIANGSSNGIDTALFNPALFPTTQKEELRASLNIHPDDFVFIFIGRLVKDKGINELVAAFKRVTSCKLVRRGGLQVQSSRFKVQGLEYDVATSPTLHVSKSPSLQVSPSSPLPLSHSKDSKLKTQNYYSSVLSSQS